jgi:hypothetical protein
VRGQVYSRDFRRDFFSASRESAFNRETFSDLPPPHGTFSTVSIPHGDFRTPSPMAEECFTPRKIECRWGGKEPSRKPHCGNFPIRLFQIGLRASVSADEGRPENTCFWGNGGPRRGKRSPRSAPTACPRESPCYN